MNNTINRVILSLGGIADLNGSCPIDATDDQLQAFLNAISYAPDREPITVQQVREQLAAIEAADADAQRQASSLDALQYLASTDWYVIRQQETGKTIPAEVLIARQQARDSI